jgi:hypothetical protein
MPLELISPPFTYLLLLVLLRMSAETTENQPYHLLCTIIHGLEPLDSMYFSPRKEVVAAQYSLCTQHILQKSINQRLRKEHFTLTSYGIQKDRTPCAVCFYPDLKIRKNGAITTRGQQCSSIERM